MTARTPRRLRPSVERRGDVSVDTHTALSAKGEVRSAAPVTEGGRKATIYVPPTPAVGAVLMQTAFESAVGSSNDPITWDTGLGGTYDIGPVGSYVALTGGVLTLLQSCWVQVSIRIDMSSVTAGKPVELYLSLDGDPIGEIDRSPAKSSGVARSSLSAGPYWFDFDNDDPTIYAGVNADDGSGSFNPAVIKIVALSGVTP